MEVKEEKKGRENGGWDGRRRRRREWSMKQVREKEVKVDEGVVQQERLRDEFVCVREYGKRERE